MQLRPPSVNGCRKGAGHGSSGTPECSGSQFPHGMDQRRSGAPLPRRSRLQGAHENVRRRTAPSVLLRAAILRQPSILRNVIRPLATRLPSRISAVASWSRSVTEIAVPACTAMASGWHPLRHSSGLEIPVAQSLLRKLPPARRASNMLLCLTGGRPMEGNFRSEEHTSELQSPCNLVCRLLLEKKKKEKIDNTRKQEQSNNTTKSIHQVRVPKIQSRVAHHRLSALESSLWNRASRLLRTAPDTDSC